MTKNFLQINVRYQATDLGTLENTQQINTKNTTLWHIIFKLQNSKDKILKEARGKKQLTYRRGKIKITSDFLKTMQARKWGKNLKCCEDKTTNLKLSTPKLSFISEEEIKT